MSGLWSNNCSKTKRYMKYLFHFNVLSVANMPIRNLQLFRRKGDRNWQEAEAGGHYTCKMKEDRNGNAD